MAFEKYFHAELRRCYPPDSVAALTADIDVRYRAVRTDVSFARNSSNPVDRRLEFSAYFLATIQVLERRGATFEEIRAVCVNATESYVRPKNAWHAWLKRLPARLIRTPLLGLVTRVMSAKAGKKGHPDGFLVRVVTAPEETHGLGYGIDILECGITKLFRKHGAEKYVPILCEVDRLTSSLAGLEMLREGTLATGASKCDFRFKILGPDSKG